MTNTEDAVVINGQTPFVDAVVAAIDKPINEILRCLDSVRAGDDIEAVHDIRVATRRLRALLSVAEPVAVPKAWRRFNKAIADLTDQLGAARDTDVFIEFMEQEIGLIDEARTYERPGLEAFRDHLKSLRQAQQGDLEKAVAHLDADILKRDAYALFEEGARNG